MRNIAIIGIIAITAILLSACTLYLNEQEDAGTVTVNITIGGGNEAVDWLGELTPKDLVHTIQLLDENDEEQYRKENLSYGQKSSFSVTPGLYTFYVEAFYNGELKATGWAERIIYAGKNPDITIQMEPAVIRTLTGITVEYDDPDNTIFTDTTHDTLKEGLTVTAHYSDGTSAQVTNYTLSVEGGAFIVGENTVTVHYTEGGVTKTDTFTVDVFATHPHNWSKISETAPTCTEAGIEVWECDAIESPHHENRPGADIDPDAHLWNDNYEVTIRATCSATGIETDTCSYNHLHTRTRDIEIDPDAHDYNWTTITSATCLAEGEEAGICSHNNGHTTTRIIPIDLINGHDYQNWTEKTVPTCTTVGKEEAPCERDSSHENGIRDIPIVPDAHDWGIWALNVPVDGGETRVCAHNGSHKETRPILVFVPGGTFKLGEEVGTAGTGDTTPVSNVTLSDFYIGRHEVTQGQWRAVMGAMPSGLSIPSNAFKGDDYPMFHITWYQMLVFCNRLSMAQGLTPAYRINNSTNPSDWGTPPTLSTSNWDNVTIALSTGYRLPTEAQWEYAAKGGNPEAPGWVGYTYAGSNDPGEVAWTSENAPPNPVYTYDKEKVGMKAPNGLGLYDMTGNVAEKCWDPSTSPINPYTSEPKTDPMGAASGTYRIVRGGWVGYSAENSRIVQRSIDLAGNQNGNPYGFRLVRPANPRGVDHNVTAPSWNEGAPTAMPTPLVLGSPVGGQGWQTSADGENWTPFTATTATMADHGHYLRYYATIGGETFYSNTVIIKVIPAGSREITIDLYDNTAISGGITGDGWSGGSALRIVINGTDHASVRVETDAALNTPAGQRGTNKYTFNAALGATVELYFVDGDPSKRNNNYIVYYSDLPPNPMFTSANSSSYSTSPWNGRNALSYRLWNTNTTYNLNVADDTLLDTFTISPVNFVAPQSAWDEGSPVSLTAPAISSGSTVSAQGWQIGDPGEAGSWTNFTATTAAMTHNGKYLRYYAVIGGTTYYSNNAVRIKVYSLGARYVVVDMYDSYGDGWNGNGSISIAINGAAYVSNLKVFGTATSNTPAGQLYANTWSFRVDVGDEVQFYWVAGSYHEECSFIAYYADMPPSPAFPANSTDWAGENALIVKRRGELTSTATGTVLGSFTVP
jgi:formylglycine-generating enzyme required for sulfatase activity